MSGGRFYGVVIGIVTNNQDPDGMGRVRVKFPWLSNEDESWWARVITPIAGPGYGLWALPEVDEEVAVIFEHGDFRFPMVVGRLWNGVDKPPTEADTYREKAEVYRSKSGHLIVIDDGGAEVKIKTAGGHEIKANDKGKQIQAKTAGGHILVLDDGTNSVRAQHKDGATLELAANTDVNVTTSGNVNVNAAKVNLAGSGPAVARVGDALNVVMGPADGPGHVHPILTQVIAAGSTKVFAG